MFKKKKNSTNEKKRRKKVPASLGFEPAASYSQPRYLSHCETLTIIFGMKKILITTNPRIRNLGQDGGHLFEGDA